MRMTVWLRLSRYVNEERFFIDNSLSFGKLCIVSRTWNQNVELSLNAAHEYLNLYNPWKIVKELYLQ